MRRGHVLLRGARPAEASREQLHEISSPRMPPAWTQPGREQAFGLRGESSLAGQTEKGPGAQSNVGFRPEQV